MISRVIVGAVRRKRLGQFLTGERLATVLAALARAGDARTIVDPMGGFGDMLAACLSLGARPRLVAAVEIDPVAAQACRNRLMDGAVVVTGSAFSSGSWASLPSEWDLVITNPPYVRYQTSSKATTGSLAIPSANQIRATLIEALSRSHHLSAVELEAFTRCARNYSGLSDLAVPSWLLCAARVGLGGRLAMVVPDTWLTRDYAAPVVYVLRRFFDLEYVVVDADVSWFEDALVRATLVVAHRVRDKGSSFSSGGHLRISLPASVADDHSLVGRAFPESSPELAFAAWAEARLANREVVTDPIPAAWSDETDLVRSLGDRGSRRRWLTIDEHVDVANPMAPELLRQALGANPENLITLADLGWAVGQGLRTGANDFFYVTETAGGVRSCLIPDEVLRIPNRASRPAVRRQADLSKDGRRVVIDSRCRVLLLGGWALPEDIAAADGPSPWRPMKGDLARLVRMAAATPYIRGGKSIALPTLSAVKTNVCPHNPRKSTVPARFWYQLPPLANRHTPAMFMARVNAGHPTAYPSSRSALVVDANFSTFWPTRTNAVGPKAMMALLSSTWVTCYLEATATVLAGGALKVEATHLRRLLVPFIEEEEFLRLSVLTGDLQKGTTSGDALHEIDKIVFESLRPRPSEHTSGRVVALAARLLRDRTP